MGFAVPFFFFEVVDSHPKQVLEPKVALNNVFFVRLELPGDFLVVVVKFL